ncbi:T9SS type A sorting domain-containing protein [Paradesertivirga mongoliensis]|uniref:T9SS type A sorting domain-containing protein n=1 Tax=Paradesertivirga mongoliensis TaxID=2100740 RepID=A0ABW4ZK43_9SPHI|nr:T9SS type A sorting domain-containing protein [Pedobacter mongoliensis]
MKKILRSLHLVLVILFSILGVQSLYGQSYTYSVEGFEGNIWANSPSTFTEIPSSTGTWTAARDNVQSNAVAAFEGSFSFLFKNKTAALMSPRLDNGAGVLTYHTIRTSSRTVIVETSVDKTTWVTVDSYASTAAWTLRTVTINNPAVRYVRFSSNSNSGLYIDNVLVTSAGAPGVSTTTATPVDVTQTSAVVGGDIISQNLTTITARGIVYNETGSPDINSNKLEIPGTTGTFSGTISSLEIGKTYYVKAYAQTPDGISYGLVVPFTTRAADAPVAYWTQPFNDNSHFPTSQPTSPVTINVPGQGDWTYFNAYRSTSPLYITDGSVSALRVLKGGAYVTTPLLEDGVSELSFYEGRGDRTLTIYTSSNGGATWSLLKDIETVRGEKIVVKINSGSVNQLRIGNNSGGDTDIDNITVTVFPSGTLPSLTTSAVTDINKNTAITGGEITAAGSKVLVERGVVWNTKTAPIIADNKVPAGTGIGAFSSPLTGLPAGTLIYVRAYATSRAGTAYGNELTFTTVAATPAVLSTTAATDVKGELATSGGNVTDDGGAPITERGVCWNTTGAPTTADSKSTDGTGPGVFTSTLINLTPNTTYYYRAYAVNIAGTSYGEVKQLSTGAVALPAVTTAPITSVFSYKAVGGGTITNDGNAMTTLGLCWNTTGTPTVADNKAVLGTGAGFHSGTLTGLTENFKYFVRAYATNSVGTVYGDEITFNTPVSSKLSKPIGYAEGTTGGGTPTPENTVTVRTAAELADAINGSKSVILVSGTITTNRISGVFSNKSIIGLPGARLINLDQTKSGSGIFFLTEGSRNVIIQNLTFEGPGAYDVDGYDLLSNKGGYKIWVDHCEFQDGTDGNFDNSGDSDSITVSWCKFTYLKAPRAGGPGGSPDHRFSNLIGGSDSDAPADGRYSTTWQNCWWAPGVKARMVRARNAEIHLLNCYWNSPETADAIGITAGTFGTRVYVEGGVFNLPATAKVSDLGPGDIGIKFQDCINGAADYGTVVPPTYEYIAMPSAQVQAAITNADCGAGATLFVTENGEVYSNCPSVPILAAKGKLEQEVFTGNAIEPVVFTWSGTATDVAIESLPAGLITEKNSVAKTLTISGTPTAPGTLTVKTVGGVGLPATKQVAITFTTIAPAALAFSGDLNQSVNRGSAISDMVFTWSGGTTDVSVSTLPAGLAATKDATAKTLTISGKPNLFGAFTISTIGGSGAAVSYEAIVNVLFSSAKYKVAYVTNGALPTYTNDTKILTGLKGDPNFAVTEVSSSIRGTDYSIYDLVIFSEVAGSEDPGVLELKGLNKPFVMMKVHSYKNAAAAWSWSNTETAYNQSATDTKIQVTEKTHPIFAGINFINGNEVQILSSVGSLKGLTYMDPSQFKNVSGGTIQSLATVGGQVSQVSILEIPAGTTVSGTPINQKFIQIGINSASYAQVTADGVTIVRNACLYLMGNELVEPPLHTLASTDNREQTVVSGTAISDIVFTWGGGATDVTVTGLPVGLTSSKNPGAKTLTISGTPSGSGTYTVTTTGGSKPPVSLQGTVNMLLANPTLSVTANHTQSVIKGTAITSIVFTWGGGATDVTVTGLPAGLTSSKDAGAKTLTISGTPEASGTYTVVTIGGAVPAVSLQGTVNMLLASPTLTLTSNHSQAVVKGTAISNIIFTWGGGATDVTVTGLPAGLTSSKDAGARTLTISGTPDVSGTYTVTTIGGAAPAVSLQGTVLVSLLNPTLAVTNNHTQNVIEGLAITNIVFTWGGGATDITISGLPSGLTISRDAAARTVTVSGTPGSSSSYTAATIGGASPAASVQGTINVLPANPTLEATANHNQTVIKGAAISNIIFTWGGAATGVALSGLPAGLSSHKDEGKKTLTISGTPVESGTYMVSTTGSSAPAMTLQGGITVAKGINEVNMVLKPTYVTNETVLSFHGNMSQTSEILVMDINGRIVLRKSIAVVPGMNELNIDMGNLRAGVYICSMQIDGQSHLKRVIKL